MAPELESTTNTEELHWCKFVREAKRIVYDSADLDHSKIALKHGLDKDVDDGGYIIPSKNRDITPRKVTFASTTSTCYIRGDEEKQRIITTNVAKKILGEDRVEG